MFIAQLSVAGEGELHPEKTPGTTAEADQYALNEFLAVQSNLPWTVFRAAHRAATLPTLPTRARSVLAALARTVDASRPYAAIFARRELLTDRSMQSMRTFYRSLEDLEVAGFIERAPQKRYGDAGLFGRAYLHLTPRAAITLGYVVDPAAQAPTSSEKAQQPHVVDGSTARPNSDDLSFLTPSASVADGAIYKDLFPKNQKRQPASLPADLDRLRGLGFHRFLIFKLMREAKQNAKLLSDVVDVTWEHLKSAKHPISYLRKLLQSPVDFTQQIKSRLAANSAVLERARQTAEYEAVARQCAGKQYVDPAMTRLVSVSASGGQVILQVRGEPGQRTATQNWQKDFAEAVMNGRLIEARDQNVSIISDNQIRSTGRADISANRPVSKTAVKSTPRTMTPEIQTRLASMKTMLRACSAIAMDCTGMMPAIP